MPALVTTGPSFLSSSVFAVAFIWLSLALGRRLLRWFGITESDLSAEWLVIAFALGAGSLQLVPLVLGAAGVLRVSTLRIAIAALAIALGLDLLAVARKVGQALRNVRKPDGLVTGCLLVLTPALLLAALLAFTPTIDPDGLGYHLTVPKRWLALGSLDYLPTYPYSNTPMGVEMLFTIALSFAGDAAAKTLHLTCGLFAALSLYLAGKRLRGELVGALAAVLFLVGPFGVVNVLGCAYLEGAVTLAMGASALAWIIWFQAPPAERRAGWLRAAFALAGIGVSFKLTAALFPIAIATLTLAAITDRRAGRETPLGVARLPLWSLLPCVALPILPWLVRSALVTGNPIFPLFARFIPSRDLSPGLAKQFDDYNRYMLWASRAGAHLSLEQRKLILLGVGLITLAIAGFVFVRERSRVARAVTLVLAVTVLVQLAAVGLYGRYWIPALAVMQLPVLAALSRAIPGLPSKRALSAALLVVTGVGALLQIRQCVSSVNGDVRGLVLTALGIEPQRSFVLAHLPLFPLYEQANRELPPDAKIVLSTYCGGFYLDRTTYCAEFVQDSLRLTSWNAFSDDVRRLEVSDVLAPRDLNTKNSNDAEPGGGSVSELFRRQQNEYVGRLLDEHGHLLGAASDQGLYAVDRSAL